MSAPSARTRTTAFQWSSALTGVLVLLAFLMVGAWPVMILLGVPPLVAAAVAGRPRVAAVLAGLPALAVVVWWALYWIGRGFRIADPPQVELIWLLAGPAAAVTVPLAVVMLARPDRFSRDPVRA